MTDKTRETRVRRMAERQGVAIYKSRRRDPRARDYGTYSLCWVEASYPETSWDAWVGQFRSLDEVERWLLADQDTRPTNQRELDEARERAHSDELL